MPYCVKCGAQLDVNALFCPNCDTPINIGASLSTDAMSGINNLILKKKNLSVSEHYDFEDRAGAKLGQADCDFFLHPAKIIVTDTSGSVVMYFEEKTPSLRNKFIFYDAAGAEQGTIQRKLAKFFGEEEF